MGKCRPKGRGALFMMSDHRKDLVKLSTELQHEYDVLFKEAQGIANRLNNINEQLQCILDSIKKIDSAGDLGIRERIADYLATR